MSLKPWREIAAPHPDVLEGTFQQSEFAADISAVRDGRAPREYQDAAAFFERTFITEGMRLLLVQVAHRLNGQGGEPVIQLQTAFGGGKTHTMLAVYHLATRPGSLQDLAGVPALLDQAGLMDIPRAKVAILDGTAHAPGQPWRHAGHPIHTLWGELAWQLGGVEGYDLVRQADTTGTSPGKDVLRDLLARHAPCVVLIDELVAYIRQFADGQSLSGGTFNSNLSFVQALTEATKLVPGAVVLASLPESVVEVGDSRGIGALKALKKTFGRVQALWKPVATEEGFEIVRRRLFEPIRDLNARDEVCRAFAEMYRHEGVKLPSETQEARYADRLCQAYPIHPEIFDRLYEDWTSLEAFQRTRGVLKLMARVIYRLWKDNNKDLMITPGSLPLYDSGSRDELTYYLAPGWEPVIEKDIDGDRAETTQLDTRETRFGAVQAGRRVGRTLFLGSAPASVSTAQGNRGIDRARVLLGCLQPGQASSLFGDALNRLADRLHYLNASGDKALDATRFWFDTRANLRREMEDRKGRFDSRRDVQGKIATLLSTVTVGVSTGDTGFGGVHTFTGHADVPDDSTLRLVLLAPEKAYFKADPRAAVDAVQDYVRHNGTKPRFKGNRLIFVAADAGSIGRLLDSVRTALAWASIVEDVGAGRLNIDRLQENQAKKEAQTAAEVALRATRDCYRWVLCPVMHNPTDRDIEVEAFALNTSGSSFAAELGRVCVENELVIATWSPIHLRSRLQALYWKAERQAVRAMTVWEDMQKYLYLPRLKTQSVLEKAIIQGAASKEFFGTALGIEGDRYVGFNLGSGGVQLDDTLLLIEPAAADEYAKARREEEEEEEERRKKEEIEKKKGTSGGDTDSGGEGGSGGTETDDEDDKDEDRGGGGIGGGGTRGPGGGGTLKAKTHFFGAVEVSAAAAKMKLVDVADEVIALLASDPSASVKVTVEIVASFPAGAPDHVERGVAENTSLLGFKTKDWE